MASFLSWPQSLDLGYVDIAPKVPGKREAPAYQLTPWGLSVPTRMLMSPGTWLVFLSRNLICQQVMKLFMNFLKSPLLGSETLGHGGRAFLGPETSMSGP